jgi:DNA-binding transcriptional regulator GbsR (MarR family)
VGAVMDDERRHFIEDFGGFFEDLGGGRMVGRILGLLMVADPPAQTAEDIATALAASRGSVSQATRILVQLGMVRRLSRPGDRRDWFELRTDAFTEAMRRRTAEITHLIAMFERAQDITGDKRPHLEEALAFMRFWRSNIDAIFADWKMEREGLLDDQRNPDP